MNIPITTTPVRITEPAVSTNQAQEPPRPLPAAIAHSAAVPVARPEAGSETARTLAEQRQELETELAAANRKFADDGHEVRFEYDREASRLIVRLIEIGTQKVLRQYPSDEALRVARLVKSGKPLISMQA